MRARPIQLGSEAAAKLGVVVPLFNERPLIDALLRRLTPAESGGRRC